MYLENYYRAKKTPDGNEKFYVLVSMRVKTYPKNECNGSVNAISLLDMHVSVEQRTE